MIIIGVRNEGIICPEVSSSAWTWFIKYKALTVGHLLPIDQFEASFHTHMYIILLLSITRGRFSKKKLRARVAQ